MSHKKTLIDGLEIRTVDGDELDEICGPCEIHLERMSDTGIWMSIQTKAGKRFNLNVFSRVRASIGMRLEEDAVNGREWTGLPWKR